MPSIVLTQEQLDMINSDLKREKVIQEIHEKWQTINKTQKLFVLEYLKVLHPQSSEFLRMGSGFAGDFHRRFYSCLFANSWFKMCRLGRSVGRGGPQRSKGGEIPAVTDTSYSHGMFEISELERQGFCQIF